MAKKTKDLEKVTEKKTTEKKVASTKKVNKTNTVAAKKSSTKKTTKTEAASKKATKAKTTSTKTAKVKTTATKTTKTNSKSVKKSVTKKTNPTKGFKSEYYDLPYFYNKTVVKILAQTPKMLFIYWEIAESDRKKLQKQYGSNFFETTRPVLIVFNDTMHYSFEVDINDFANSWYLHINDANCNYHVELGRRPIASPQPSTIIQGEKYIPYYLYITSSNQMESPNNHILFDPNIKTIKFRNFKTGQVTNKDINQFTFITNFGIFKIQDLYRFLFPNESFEYENIVLGNTSSGALSSSGMFSSQFK